MDRRILVPIGILVGGLVVGASMLGFAYQLSTASGGAPQPPTRFASEPFPALWQTNVSGTPYSALVQNGTIFVLTYGNSTSAPPPFGPSYPWTLLAIRASTGGVIWNHQILVSNESNSYPELVEFGGTVYFVQAGSSLALDSVNVSSVPALYALGFDPLNGKRVSLADVPTPAGFFFGLYDVVGSRAVLAWPVWSGTTSTMTVESYDLLGVSAAKALWTRSFLSGGGDTNLGALYADSQYVVVPFGGLYVLNARTGNFLYNSSIASSDMYNAINGALVGGVFYLASEWLTQSSPETVQLDLLGLDLANHTVAVNSTVTTLAVSSEPIAVRSITGYLVVPWVSVPPLGSGPFSVYDDNGTLQWSSAGRSVSVESGAPSVSLGVPWAALSNGDWVLTSLSTPSGSGDVATQYFELIQPSNGTVAWASAFSFHSLSNDTMFYPPNGLGPPSVVFLASTGSALVYRWGGSLGYAEL